jgi:hypothetical protein
MATIYQISISLSSETIQQLQAGDYSLQVFKGIKCNQRGALPALWYSDQQFTNTIELNWTDDFSGYISNQTLAPGTIVDIGNNIPVSLGSQITLEPDGSIMTTSGPDSVVTVINEQNTPYICGFTQSLNGGIPSAICALPLFPQQPDVMAPYGTLVLAFSTGNLSPCTLVEHTATPSVTVLLAAQAPSVSIAFDINYGWMNINNDPTVFINPLPINLAQTLIVPVS